MTTQTMTPADALLDSVRAYRRLYNATLGARSDQIADARAAVSDARKRVAELVEEPDKMDAAYAAMRKAQARLTRMRNTDQAKREEAREVLIELREQIDAQLAAFGRKQ